MSIRDRLIAWLASVTAVAPGKDNDGLISVPTGGTPLDRDWHTLLSEFNDAREAFAKNPLARRLVLLLTAYVVGGQGISLKAERRGLQRFINEFEAANNLRLRQADWCEELSRSGELFVSLHMGADGVPLVRAKPASQIREIAWKDGDYETETEYVEEDLLGQGRRWRSRWTATQAAARGAENNGAFMLHYAVNRPVGCLRGQSDLASILPWLRRYSRWLDDRVRLNAAMRAFLWIVKAPASKIKGLAEKYRTPPEAGSVLVVDRDNEEWLAVTPDIKAADAAPDGRAIRWMIVAGGPGTGLTDVGEAETANLATAEAMGEQRRRFLRQRQLYFGWLLSDLVVSAWNWSIDLGLRRGRHAVHADIDMVLPDLAPSDNAQLAGASKAIAEAMTALRGLVGDSAELRALATELTIKFAGETINDIQLHAISHDQTPATHSF